VLDFASALYLGLRHESCSLRAWDAFTTGVPAGLAEWPAALTVARRLAQLQGCERATLAPSTLHVFWDLFQVLGDRNVAIYIDDGTYATAQWGVERAAAHGVPVRHFPHHDVGSLQRLIDRHDGRGIRPFVVADGFCPACGVPAPIPEYVECARSRRGLLILDDTQALGILGWSAGDGGMYGIGGGGSLRSANVAGADVAVISSLAKAFGVPVAALSGSTELVGRFVRESETRVHCSPPSIPVIHAADRALTINERNGERLRRQLSDAVRYFRTRVSAAGLVTLRSLFPVQTLRPGSGGDPVRLHDRLRRAGIRSVLRRGRQSRRPLLSFIITARHTTREIDRLIDVLADGAQASTQTSKVMRT
jgi:8-amino-7-oxononanoate synthase